MAPLPPLCIVPSPAGNAPTVHRASPHRQRSVAELFVATYPRFAPACRDVDEPGVVAIAIDEVTRQLIGVCGLRACLGRSVTAVLGRHANCDLVLRGEDIALRHVAIVIEPVVSWASGARACYRAFDLRTTGGMVDEVGRPLRSFRADGPAVVRCGGQVIFLLPLGDPSDWPAHAESAWDMLPQRIYLDECGGLARSHARTSMIFRAPDVRSSADLIAGELAGTLEVVQPGYSSLVACGRQALHHGILLGRYARCDLPGELDDSVSRVHALLLEAGNRVILVDLASTHGLGPTGGGRARVAELVDGSSLWLARNTQLRWRETSR